MKKRVLCIVLLVAMMLNLSMSAFAAQGDVSIVIDNKEVEFTESSGEPFVDANGRTQVPLRVVMEQYGCDVEWDSANNAAVITKGDTTVIVPIGQSYILVNGKTVAMDTAALVQNGRTYVPIRAVLEAFGADVEWDNGKISVTSPASGEFENIYIDKDGNLIFELANGNKINAGSVSNGKDGRDGSDGVSVVNAYVDGSGNLMIALSNGRTINAGNVGVGGSMSGLTFADYSVGTKFYLTQPTGAFDVTVIVGNVPYVVEFDSVYYELTAKHSYDDADAWTYKDGKNSSTSYFLPYEVTMYINGQTDATLAGKTVQAEFGSDITGGWSYGAVIASDGSFSVSHTHGGNGDINQWNAPVNVFLRRVSIYGNSSPEPDEEDPAITAMLAKVAGTWSIPSDTTKTFTITADGTITCGGTDYTPRYSMIRDHLFAYVTGCEDVREVNFDGDATSAYVTGGNGGCYYKNGTWDVVTLTKDNFFTYYEYEEVFKINYNAFGEYEDAHLYYYYVLKDEYASLLIENESTATAKIQSDTYRMEYAIDFENESYSVTEPGELLSSHTYSRDCYSHDTTTIFLDSIGLYASDTTNTARFRKIQLIDAIGTLYLIKNS